MMQRILTCLSLGLAAALLTTPASALQECVGAACSKIEVKDASGAQNGMLTLSVDFTQAPSDSQTDRGNDDIAAVAFTIGIPGSGSSTPLRLNCTDANSDGLPDSVRPGAALSGFKLVVENALCTNRNRCLCPGEGQTRDNFINIAVYGPKDLPAEGPVNIPVIPSGRLVDIDLQVGGPSEAPQGTFPAHVFNELDDQLSRPKPQFGAFFSQGDKSAVDETADRGGDRSKITFVDGTIEILPGTACGCPGDCNNDGFVTVDELIKGVNIALGNQQLDTCLCFDGNGDEMVTINELITAVNRALNGCSAQ